jgi:hypothetical protein
MLVQRRPSVQSRSQKYFWSSPAATRQAEARKCSIVAANDGPHAKELIMRLDRAA